MIVSANSEPEKEEFDFLLRATIFELNSHAQKSSNRVSKLLGRDLEPFVKDVMTNIAVGTPFENSIELIGGQRFPDIVAKKFYGIEVKTTTQNHWKTTGNSVLETTRVESVERIFMLFAKLAAPIEFRCRPYEECLSEVVVTHSPRYLIDMNLEKGNTIFDKIKTPYDTLRKNENPIKPIVDYYKSRLKAGENLWWIGQDNDISNNLVIKVWNNLTKAEQQRIRSLAMLYFPEVFGSSNRKYQNIPVWLVTNFSVVCPNIRDLFSAKGQGIVIIGDKVYRDVPRVFVNLFENLEVLIEELSQIPALLLSEYWQMKTTEDSKVSDWINHISNQSKGVIDAKHLNIKLMISEYFRY